MLTLARLTPTELNNNVYCSPVRRSLWLLLGMLLAVAARAGAQPGPNLVLLPLQVSQGQAQYSAEYGAALAEGLQSRYEVFYGPQVERQLEKEYNKIDCDAEECWRNIAIAFNGELVADASVKEAPGGYLLKLVVSNVLTGQQVETQSRGCEGCSVFKLIDELKTLGRQRASINTGPAAVRVDATQSSSTGASGERAILIFDSQPTGAAITINGQAVGTTPYQGLSHTIGDQLAIGLSKSNHTSASFNLTLSQGITQLQPIVLNAATGDVVIASEPFVAGAQVLIDGQAVGAAPLVTSLPAGEHQIEIKTAKATTGVKTIQVTEGNNSPITLALGGGNQISAGGVEYKLVDIPAGSFQMGSIVGFDGDKSVHRVTIKSFKMMEHEVTWDQYQPCIDAGACPNNDGAGGDSGWGKGNRPVINVSWEDITQHYIPWLNQATGQKFRLPTEAEWEYAARGGTSTHYSWGDDFGRNQANCDGCGSRWDGSKTAPVKSFSPNAYGLYDMHGNVWEWTQDCWNGPYTGAPRDGSAWLSGDCGGRLLRGGSWNFHPGHARSASRYWSGAGGATNKVGFRLARTLYED